MNGERSIGTTAYPRSTRRSARVPGGCIRFGGFDLQIDRHRVVQGAQRGRREGLRIVKNLAAAQWAEAGVQVVEALGRQFQGAHGHPGIGQPLQTTLRPTRQVESHDIESGSGKFRNVQGTCRRKAPSRTVWSQRQPRSMRSALLVDRSMSGRQGTRLKSRPSESIANRPLTRLRLWR